MSDQKNVSDQEYQELVEDLPRRIIRAQEEERERISKEIHDDLGQSLAALKMLVQSSVKPEYLSVPQNRRAYTRVVSYIDEIIDKSRHIATTLRPRIIETMGLTRAVKKLLVNFRKNKNVHIRARIGQLDDLEFQGGSVHLYRIVQEALANLLHHAEASHVEIICRRNKYTLSMVIRDNGKGFLPEDVVQDAGRGNGLSTMQERARIMGGELNIESAPGHGAVIRLQVPVRQNGSKQGRAR
ncbi:MAG: sensor histidine kinase [Candidatus Omnitrophota bacterium]